MISYDTVYEVVDLRLADAGRPVLAPAAMLRPLYEGLELLAANGYGFVLPLSGEGNEEENVEFRQDLDQIVLHTEAGAVVLTPLTLERYERSVRPFIDGPAFATTDAVQKQVRQMILTAEVP